MKKTFLILTAALALVSCKKENDNNNGNPTPETPFSYNKNGHRWVYDFVYNGSVVDSLVNEITADSNGIYTMVSKDQMVTQTNYMFADGDYLRSYAKGKAKTDAIRVSKHNAKQGDTWLDVSSTGDSIESAITQVNVPVTVPAGTFACTAVFVKDYKNKYNFTNYINPKAGLVKIDMGTIKYELRGKNF